MKCKYLLGVLIVMITCSCVQLSSNSKAQTQKVQTQHLDWNSGLRVENGLIQGLSFTNSLGTEYGHAYSTNTIYNDSTVSIHLQIDLSKEYNLPAPHNDKKFKVITWPEELKSDKTTSSDSLSNELRNFLQYGSETNESMNISLGPHEKIELTTGTLFEKRINNYISPNMLYIHQDGSVLGNCKNLINKDKPSNDSIVLGLRLDIPDEGCIIISYSQILYTEH